jgi:cholesterol transport system auxiliary component
MIARSRMLALAVIGAVISLAGCGSLLETTLPAPQSYVLRLPPGAVATSAAPAGSILVLRPDPGPGLDSNRIMLLRSEKRFDSYAASLWAAPAPELVGSILVDALRRSGEFSNVFDDHAPYPPRYDLRVRLRRFEADYTVDGGSGAPTVFVTLDATLGQHRERALITHFSVEGSAKAADDRMSAVVAAFETAMAAAAGDLAQAAAAAVAGEPRADQASGQALRK